MDNLVGRYLILDSLDGEYWTLSRFCQRLTRHLYLMTALSPQTGEPNKTGDYVIDIRSTAIVSKSGEPSEKIVKLVMKS